MILLIYHCCAVYLAVRRRGSLGLQDHLTPCQGGCGILFVVALPAMIGYLTVAGGIALLFPLCLVTLAFGVLKVYI